MILCQLLFSALQAGPHRKFAFDRVIVQHPAPGLEIIDAAGVQQLDAAARQLQHHLTAPAPLDSLDRAGQLGAELIVVHRLEHIVQGIHLIAPDGILRHVRHEHQHHVRIHGPDLFRRAEAIQPRHLHVHKEDVPAQLIVFCSRRPVLKGRHFSLQAMLCSILPDEPAQLLPHFRLILDHCNFQHPAASFSSFPHIPPSAARYLLLKHTFVRNATRKFEIRLRPEG